jgi:Uncharacterised nucleotidyltransferase
MILLPQTSNKSLPMNARKEEELLLCCARTHMSPATASRIRTLLLDEIDWEYLFGIAQWHGVMPLLYHSLKSTCPESVPQAKFQQLRSFFQANSCHTVFLTQKLITILRLFENHEIPALPFKGAILAASVYGDLCLRQTRDLDILVHTNYYQKAKNILISEGYEVILDLPWECHFILDGDIICIDLHFKMLPKSYSRSIDDKYWWENSQSFCIDEETFPNLLPEACFFMLCLHGTKDCWETLHRICDIAETVRTYAELDWESILDRATRLGCKRIVSLALLLTKDLLEISLPEKVLKEIESDATAKFLSRQVIQQLFSEPIEEAQGVPQVLFHMSTRERVADRFEIFVSLMNTHGWFTPSVYDEQFLPLPKFLYFLYYLIRPIRLLGRYRLSLANYLRIKKL